MIKDHGNKDNIYNPDKELKTYNSLPGIDQHVEVPRELLLQLVKVGQPFMAEEMEECKKRLIKAQERIRDLEEIYADVGIELRNSLREKECLSKELREIKESANVPYDFCPLYDIRMFKNYLSVNPPPEYVRSLWNVFYIHSTNTTPDGNFYIDNTTSATIAYKIIHESTRIPYQFTGSYNDFCASWNANVASRHKDPERKKKLTCNEATIRAEYNKTWKSISIGDLEENRFHSNKHKCIFPKANEMITRVIPDLLKIPTD